MVTKNNKIDNILYIGVDKMKNTLKMTHNFFFILDFVLLLRNLFYE